MSAPPAIAVVGGGISGLAGALQLADGGARVVLFEAAARLGGKILTEEFGGTPMEAGPDAFLARAPWAVELCRRLGLGGELVAPAETSASVLLGGRLHRLPEGLVMGVPTRWGPLLRSGILSPAGLARAALDLVLPTTKGGGPGDRSVAEMVSDRLGHQVVDRLVGPLVSGINAGRADLLSASAAVPALDAAARGSRSLVLGLRRSRTGRVAPPQGAPNTTSSNPEPVFLTHPGGLSTIVNALADVLLARQVDLRTATPVTGLHASPGRSAHRRAERAGDRIGQRWVLETPSESVEVDGILLAVPAFVAGAVLGDHFPEAAAQLAAIHYASVAMVTLAYPLQAGLPGSGYLVPAGLEGRMTTACTFASRKWAHLSNPQRAIFRASVGRWGDRRHEEMDDAALLAVVRAELAEVLDLRGEPVGARVNRWPRSFPQYEVGHAERIARIEADLAGSRVGIAGAAYRGIGIPACIGGAQVAARGLLRALAAAGE